MRLLLYEPNHTGHHYPYLARLLPGLTPLGLDIVLATTPEGVESEEFARTLAPLAERFRVEAMCTAPPRGVLANARHRLRELDEAAARVRPDHTFLLYADSMWQLLTARALLGRPPACGRIEAWIYRGGFAYPDATRPIDRISRALMKRAVRRDVFAALHIDDELAYDFALRHWRIGGPRLVLTPNPVTLFEPADKREARRRLGLPEGGRLVTLSGMIQSFKGADLLVRAFAERRRASPGDRLLLAGPHADEITRMLASRPYAELVAQGAILSLDRFLSEEEMFLAAAAGDLTVAPYPNHSGRSSIILWAAAAGRPVLGAARGCIGHVIRTQKLGRTVDPTDHDAFVKALADALDAPWSEHDARRARSYAQTHSVERYRESVSSLIRERLREQGD